MKIDFAKRVVLAPPQLLAINTSRRNQALTGNPQFTNTACLDGSDLPLRRLARLPQSNSKLKLSSMKNPLPNPNSKLRTQTFPLLTPLAPVHSGSPPVRALRWFAGLTCAICYFLFAILGGVLLTGCAATQGDLAAIYIDEVKGNDLWLQALFTCRTEDWHFLETALIYFLRRLNSLQAAGDQNSIGRQILKPTSLNFT